MIKGRKIVNFAKALFKTQGTSEQVQARQSNLEQLTAAITSNPKILYLLDCPEMPVESRLTFIKDVLKIELDPYVRNLVAIVLKANNANWIPKISWEYHKLVVHGLKELEVELTTAVPFTEQARKELINKLEQKFDRKIDLVESVDDSLLSGFTLLVHNKMLDLSIKGSITNLKNQLLKA